MSRLHGTKESWLAAVRGDGAAFLAEVGEPGALTAAVPSCPGWTVADLTRHLGAFYHRIRLYGDSRRVDESWPPLPAVTAAHAPAADDPGVVAWFADELTGIEAFLDALAPDVPVWNWAPQAKTGAFWHRRAAHETAVHRWDAQLATGLPEPIEGKLAGDTVAEALDTFLPAGRRHAHSDVSGDVSGLARLVAADLGQEWYVRLRGDGVALLDTDTLLDDAAHPARAAASGTASDLALALWGRVTFDVLATTGDIALLRALRVS